MVFAKKELDLPDTRRDGDVLKGGEHGESRNRMRDELVGLCFIFLTSSNW